MIKFVAAYAMTAAVFLTIDFLWLSRIAKAFYVERLGALLLDRPNALAAGIFYSIYVAGIVIFAVAPALRDGSAQTALVMGTLFGFFAYATYDMTNLATLRNWPLAVTLADIAWGTFLTGISAMLGFLATRLLFPVG